MLPKSVHRRFFMADLRIWVPTYFGEFLEHQKNPSTREEFDHPLVPVLAREAGGLRVVLGSHDLDDLSFPDILIERRPRGWAIFLHPLGGSDPSACVCFLDDGRSFLIPENDFGPTPVLEV